MKGPPDQHDIDSVTPTPDKRGGRRAGILAQLPRHITAGIAAVAVAAMLSRNKAPDGPKGTAGDDDSRSAAEKKAEGYVGDPVFDAKVALGERMFPAAWWEARVNVNPEYVAKYYPFGIHAVGENSVLSAQDIKIIEALSKTNIQHLITVAGRLTGRQLRAQFAGINNDTANAAAVDGAARRAELEAMIDSLTSEAAHSAVQGGGTQ